MTYLRCPRCRMTVMANPMHVGEFTCPRCRAKLGETVRLERGNFPVRAGAPPGEADARRPATS